MRKLLLPVLLGALLLPGRLLAQPEPVDLGLSVKWASCNLGADSPEDPGDLYAWGELKPKNSYVLDNYKFFEPGPGQTSVNPWNLDWLLTKYCSDKEYGPQKTHYGTVDRRVILELEDDVANVKLGGKWRIPMQEERDELFNECTWTWKKVKGVPGYEVTSKVNGNSIFLPVTGYFMDEDLIRPDELGYYWTSSLYLDDPRKAIFWGFSEKEIYPRLNQVPNPYGHQVAMWSRAVGFAIRPVILSDTYQYANQD